jgi:hypothetical protein
MVAAVHDQLQVRPELVMALVVEVLGGGASGSLPEGRLSIVRFVRFVRSTCPVGPSSGRAQPYSGSTMIRCSQTRSKMWTEAYWSHAWW